MQCNRVIFMPGCKIPLRHRRVLTTSPTLANQLTAFPRSTSRFRVEPPCFTWFIVTAAGAFNGQTTISLSRDFIVSPTFSLVL